LALGTFYEETKALMQKIHIVRVVKGGWFWGVLVGKCGVAAPDRRSAIEAIKADYPGEYEVIDIVPKPTPERKK
jgi:hypothetical protein